MDNISVRFWNRLEKKNIIFDFGDFFNFWFLRFWDFFISLIWGFWDFFIFWIWGFWNFWFFWFWFSHTSFPKNFQFPIHQDYIRGVFRKFSNFQSIKITSAEFSENFPISNPSAKNNPQIFDSQKMHSHKDLSKECIFWESKICGLFFADGMEIEKFSENSADVIQMEWK